MNADFLEIRDHLPGDKMSIFMWILFGSIAGFFARRIMPGPSAGGLGVAIPIGIGGALIGGLAGATMNGRLAMEVDGRSLLMAMTASMLLLLCYRGYALRLDTRLP
jgi:uncharacterized membrane protein YeaQ/YmgE (transglycosylase-associated protein family)